MSDCDGPSQTPAGYRTRNQRVAIAGVDDLLIRSLLDRQQFHDPDGEALAQGISSATWPLFGLLWPSSAQLAAQMAMRPIQAGERILELGCGLALASLVAHRRGADVTASDCHPLTERFLLENLRLNELPPMKYRHGHWGVLAVAPGSSRPGNREHVPNLDHVTNLDRVPTLDRAATPAPPVATAVVHGQFELIVGSDLLYEPGLGEVLADFISIHAGTHAEIWIVDPDRQNRSAFNRSMRLLGYSRSEQRLDVPAGAGVLAYKGRLLRFAQG